MSVRGTLGGIFASAAVLIVGWQIGSAALGHPTATTSTSGTAASGGSTGSSGTSSSGTPSSGASSSSGSSSTLKDGSYTGTTVQTPYGEIQVAITVAGGRITDVATPTLQADDGRSKRINSQAAPMLKQEVLQAQSAKVGMISGATFTSRGYLTSLQSALDQAA
jgi:uncharacterized protein with FMN-binding domain